MFTNKSTINDILKDDVVMAHFEYMMPKEFLDIVPEDMRDMSAEELEQKLTMPWGVPYLGPAIMEIANKIHELIDSDRYEFLQLWSDKTPEGFFPATDGVKEHMGLMLFKNSFEAGRPMALVAPGGAYMNVAISNEGMDTAEALAKAGYAVAVTNYRCTPNYYPVPQMDLAIAIKTMRTLGKQYGLMDDLLVIGYSAGGHLVASETCYFEEINQALMKELADTDKVLYEKFNGISAKADKVCLCYPVINCISENHEESFVSLTGGDDSLRDKMSIDLHVTSDYPKTFVWACDDDSLVPPSNAKRMYDALKDAGVNAMHKAYPTGEHGCATAVGTSAEGWIDEMVAFMKTK